MPPTSDDRPAWRWDLFCRVIDNYGDAGVCWRLAADLARRGHRVRLWIDDATPLAWMAPGGHPAVEVCAWEVDDPHAAADATPGEVVVEAFGCEPPPAFLQAMADAAARTGRAPAWINLEYLSAEPYVERSHGLRSPRLADPGRGLDKWFFYPGFTAATGGLLREPGLVDGLDGLDADAWRDVHGLRLRPGERLASVFCYDGADLAGLVDALRAAGEPWLLATAPGAATALARALPGVSGDGPLRVHALPFLPQPDYDRLLRASDLNLVRGEDSFVRAQWAARPFLWQIYRQDDDAHLAKLEAFLDRLRAGCGLAADAPAWTAWAGWQRAWNRDPGTPAPALPGWTPALRAEVAQAAGAWREHLLASDDLVTRLVAFVAGKR